MLLSFRLACTCRLLLGCCRAPPLITHRPSLVLFRWVPKKFAHVQLAWWSEASWKGEGGACHLPCYKFCSNKPITRTNFHRLPRLDFDFRLALHDGRVRLWAERERQRPGGCGRGIETAAKAKEETPQRHQSKLEMAVWLIRLAIEFKI